MMLAATLPSASSTAKAGIVRRPSTPGKASSASPLGE
jgi:hypothetical protein